MHKYNRVDGFIGAFIECMTAPRHNLFINLFLLSFYAIRLVVNHILPRLIIKQIHPSRERLNVNKTHRRGGSIAARPFTVPLIEKEAALVFTSFDNITRECMHAQHTLTRTQTYAKKCPWIEQRGEDVGWFGERELGRR